MDTDGIKRRIGRLDELSRGLAKEVVLMKAGDDPLLYLERTRAAREEQGEQAADPAGDGKATPP